jgi:trigger factor
MQTQTTLEVLSGLERKITVKTSADHIDQEVEKRLRELTPQMKLDGFRPGKVPMHLLRKRFSESIRYEVIEKVIDKTYREALAQEKLTPAGMPQIHITHDKTGEPLEYQATVEIYPEITLNSLESATIENIHVDITQKDVDNMIQKLRKQKAKWSAVDRASEKGDKVTVSFEGRENGELFQGGSAKNVPLELGSGTTIPGFEEGFTGHKAGDAVVMNLTFPADYHAVGLAGKPVEFTGTLHKVEAAQLPALDEDFAKQMGVKEGGMEALRKTVLENMQHEVKQKVQEHLKNQVIEKLLAAHPTDIPKVLITQEAKSLMQQEQAYLAEMTGNKQMRAEPSDEILALAQKRVHLGLVFQKLVSEYKITANSEAVDKLLKELTVSYEDPEMVMQMYRENNNLYRQLEEKAIENELIEKLVAQASVTQKTMSYHEFKGFKSIQENAHV